MGERTSHKPGTFSWTDLGTTDADGAKKFYAGLFGWEFDEAPMPEDDRIYSTAKVDGKAVCGIYPAIPEQGPAAWTSYVTVEDCDATSKRVGELGGKVFLEPFDVGDAGRMSVLGDPTGGAFAIWEPKDSIGAEVVNDPGALGLNQLNTDDPDKAREFYGELFGWRFEDNSSDGQAYWGIFNGDRLNGGMMPLPEDAGAPPHWLSYFTTTDLDASVAKIGDTGGAIFVEPMEIEAGRIAVAADPQGAVFALFEGEVDP